MSRLVGGVNAKKYVRFGMLCGCDEFFVCLATCPAHRSGLWMHEVNC